MESSAMPPPDGGSAKSLIEEIRRQAEDEVGAILGAARNERKAILKKARKSADEAESERLDRAEREAALIRRKIESGVELEKQRNWLAAREKVIQECMERLKEKFATFRKSPAYRETLMAWIKEGAEAVGEANMVIVAGPVEKKLLDRNVLKTIAAKMETAEAPVLSLLTAEDDTAGGGVMIRSDDGRITFDNRFAARLKRYESEIRQAVGEMLRKRDE